MHLLALETADPPNCYTQQECHSIFMASRARQRLKARSVDIMEKVLLRNNGIETRHFSYPDIETIFDADPEKLNRVFEATAPTLGSEALTKALHAAGLKASELDGLFVCTCTGYLCPGLSSFIAERVGLRANAELNDLVGMGCGAAIPTLRNVMHRLQAAPSLRIGMVAVEVCSAAFYLDDNPGVIISACLFGDGAAASIWTGNSTVIGSLEAHSFQGLHRPEKREILRFENAGGALRNRLHKSVPEEASDAVQGLFQSSFPKGQPPGLSILPHTGGRDVLDALETRLPGNSFQESRKVLRHHGNMSSPSILYVLKRHLEEAEDKPDNLWLTSFGAGFSAYSFKLTR
ncbi:MAG: type III polyketide synthase [Puniceicoccaceae bacterium]